jgi:hypothetical protein
MSSGSAPPCAIMPATVTRQHDLRDARLGWQTAEPWEALSHHFAATKEACDGDVCISTSPRVQEHPGLVDDCFKALHVS